MVILPSVVISVEFCSGRVICSCTGSDTSPLSVLEASICAPASGDAAGISAIVCSVLGEGSTSLAEAIIVEYSQVRELTKKNIEYVQFT